MKNRWWLWSVVFSSVLIGSAVIGLALAQEPSTFESKSGLVFDLPDGWQVVDSKTLPLIANSEEAMDTVPISNGHLLITVFVDPFEEWELEPGTDATAQDVLKEWGEGRGMFEEVEDINWPVENAHDVDIAMMDVPSEPNDWVMVIALLPDFDTVVLMRAQSMTGEMDAFREGIDVLLASLTMREIIPPTATPTGSSTYTSQDGLVEVEVLGGETVAELEDSTIRVANFPGADEVEALEPGQHYHEAKVISLDTLELEDDTSEAVLKHIIETHYPDLEIDRAGSSDLINLNETLSALAFRDDEPVFFYAVFLEDGVVVLVSSHWLSGDGAWGPAQFLRGLTYQGEPVVVLPPM
jgi:hypothetical protein